MKNRNFFLQTSKGRGQLTLSFHQGALHGHSIIHLNYIAELCLQAAVANNVSERPLMVKEEIIAQAGYSHIRIFYLLRLDFY